MTPGERRRRSELLREAARARTDAGRLIEELGTRDRLVGRLDESRAAALVAVLTGLAERQSSQVGKLEGEPDVPAWEPVSSRLSLATRELESMLQLVRTLLSQREDTTLGPALQIADTCVTDAFRALGTGGRVAAAPPIVRLESNAVPATVARGDRALLPGFDPDAAVARVPLPIVLAPPSTLAHAWLLLLLYHEVGHDLDTDHGLTATLIGPLGFEGVLRREHLIPEIRATDWTRWLREVVADVVALHLGGPEFAWALADHFEGTRAFARADFAGAHPPATIRMAVLAAVSKDTPGAGRQATNERLQPYVEDAATVARILCQAEFPMLRERTIPAAAQAIASDEVSLLATLLLADAEPTTPATLSIRLVPAAACRAVRTSDGSEATLARIQAHAEKLVREAKAAPWQTPDGNWDFLRRAIREARPDERDRSTNEKVLPIDRMAAASTMAFVGATHDRLESGLRAAFAQRKGSKYGDTAEGAAFATDARWERVEVFFLSNPLLVRMDRPERPAHELLRLKAKAIEDLARGLPELARYWAVFDYDELTPFGSYLDVDAPGGRIHVSSPISGENIRSVPGYDYIRGPAPAPAVYSTHARGLVSLRRLARRLHGS